MSLTLMRSVESSITTGATGTGGGGGGRLIGASGRVTCGARGGGGGGTPSGRETEGGRGGGGAGTTSSKSFTSTVGIGSATSGAIGVQPGSGAECTPGAGGICDLRSGGASSEIIRIGAIGVSGALGASGTSSPGIRGNARVRRSEPASDDASFSGERAESPVESGPPLSFTRAEW